ncbi:MAG TPA: GAF domain-containing sensor histidine kinase [Candidatus Saccharimonadales bacterium]|nr:GAF domain-containing sensor histidine kinase [Candidatus Saccharimonadales bacterium]
MGNLVNTVDADLLSRGEPHEIMGRLVRFAAESMDVDRCTLTSLDQHVLRVEASYEHGGTPDFVGREYPLTWLQRQPLLSEAVATGTITIGGGLAENGRSDPALAPALLEVRHTAIVPLPVGDTVGAVLILSRKSDRAFVPRELEAVQQVGMLAALALRNARLVEAVQSAQRRGLDSLTQMSRHVASSMEPATFFEKMGETVAGLVHAERAVFWQLIGKELIAMHESAPAGSELLGGSSAQTLDPGSDPGLARVVFSGEALRVAQFGENGHADTGSTLARMNARDVLAVPWRTAAGPLGILTACNAELGFTDQDEWTMRLAARASALVWQGYQAEHRAEELQAAELDRLEAHARRTADLEQQKSEFLQLASHELRSPITLVSGYLSMLEEGTLGDLPEAAARVVPLMATRMRDISRLVDRMLTTSRMEMRSRDQNARAINIDELARRVVATISSAGGEAGRVVTVHSSGNTVVRADAEQVETILGNLVSNALKYSPDGGEVRVNVREEPGWVIADVADSGFGIADEDIPKLFQPFGRLHSVVAAGIEGTGLGLHVSRTLALAQGGDILVSSRLGEGSTFTLRLPSGRGRLSAGRVHGRRVTRDPAAPR